jgi:hypothetical protein
MSRFEACLPGAVVTQKSRMRARPMHARKTVSAGLKLPFSWSERTGSTAGGNEWVQGLQAGLIRRLLYFA